MKKSKRELNLRQDYLDAVLIGMREAVTYGTAASMNVPHVKVAAKTGTAQTGVGNKKMNSWVIGFFPYENPKYAFTILMESGPSTNQAGASQIMRGLLDWMYWETPEYFGLPPWPEKEEAKQDEVLSPDTSLDPEAFREEIEIPQE